MSEQVTDELLDGFLEVFNHYDRDASLDHFAEDRVVQMPLEVKPRREQYAGKNEVRAGLAI
jgi:hypothetical protein